MYLQEKEQIIATCRYLQNINYFLGTWGNISVRVGDHIVLTPSKVDYDTMKPEDMVVIDMQGNKLEGHRNPTSEKEVHRQIYLARGDITAIIHAHTEYAMAVSAQDILEVPCMVEEMSQLLGGSIPLTQEYVPAGQHEKLGLAAAKVVSDRSCVIMRNHGPVACGRNLSEAVLTAKVCEKACKIYAFARSNIMSIPDDSIASERYRFLYTYGKEKT